MQEKAVVHAGQEIDRERDHKVDLGPKKRAHDRTGIGPEFVHEHQEHDANDDGGVRDEETDKAQIREPVTQVRGDDGLERPADAPEVGHFKPAPPAGPHGHDDDEHGPVAELQGQGLRPCDRAEAPDEHNIREIIEQEQAAQRERDRALHPARTGLAHDRRQSKGQSDGQKDDGKMSQPERVKDGRHLAHSRDDIANHPARQAFSG